MQKIHLKRHVELREEVGMINLTEFSLSETVTDEDALIESFITSQYYLRDSRTDREKENPHLKFLGSPFALNNIRPEDFKKMYEKQFQEYIYEYRDNGKWHDQEEAIKNLVSRFYNIYPHLNSKLFYVLNTEWFVLPGGIKHNTDNLDPRLVEPQWWIYDFFVLIICLDPIENTLTVSEWFHD
jgi:hypothetical protein